MRSRDKMIDDDEFKTPMTEPFGTQDRKMKRMKRHQKRRLKRVIKRR